MVILARLHHMDMVLGSFWCQLCISDVCSGCPTVSSRSIPSQFPGYYPSSSESLASPSCTHSHLLLLALDKWLAEPHNLCPGSETPSEKRVGRQADHSVCKLLFLTSHSTVQIPCALCITTGPSRCQSFWCILQTGIKISSAAIQTNYALGQHVLHQTAWQSLLGMLFII